MVYKCFEKKSAGSGVNMHANNKIRQNQHPFDLATHQLAEELNKLDKSTLTLISAPNGSYGLRKY